MSVSTSYCPVVLQMLFTSPAAMEDFFTFLSTFGVSVFTFLPIRCEKGVKWYLVILIFIFLITVEVQHTHACLLSTLVVTFLLTPLLEVAASTCFEALRSGHCNPTTKIWCLV